MYRPFVQNTVKAILIPALIIGGLSACGYSKSEMHQKAKTQSTNRGTNNINTNQTNQTTKQTDRTVALRAVDIADDVPGVARATAYNYGNDIVVGVEVKSGTDPKAVQQNVANTLKKRDPGYNIHVTADRNIVTRIQGLANNYNTTNTMNPGHPVRDLATDVTSIIRDIGRSVTAPLR